MPPQARVTITFSIPPGIAKRVVDGYSNQENYPEEVEDPITAELIPNPESREEFMKRLIKEHVKDTVAAWEAKTAGIQARINAAEAAERDIIFED